MVFKALVWTSKKFWAIFGKKQQLSLIIPATAAEVQRYGNPRIGDSEHARTLLSRVINNKHTTIILFMLLTTSIVLLQVGHFPTTTPWTSDPILTPTGTVTPSAQTAHWPEGTFTLPVARVDISGAQTTAVPKWANTQVTVTITSTGITGATVRWNGQEDISWKPSDQPGTFTLTGPAPLTGNTVTLRLTNGDGTAHVTMTLAVNDGHLIVTGATLQPGELEEMKRTSRGRK